ncbi:hypothetical protein DYQ48_03000 [Xanthomonas hortorum]|nr:hypothetical protein DYQ48_03000 [Xanthomonas hortorum]
MPPRSPGERDRSYWGKVVVLNIIAPEASAVIGCCCSLQRPAIAPAAMCGRCVPVPTTVAIAAARAR